MRGDMHVTDTIEMMERAYDDWKDGRWSRAPYIDMLIPTLIDPTMAPEGKHYMSVFVQYSPYQLAEGPWNAERRMAGRIEHDRVAKIKGMSYRAALGLGFVVGIFSSLFGLGGGIVLVPTFLYFSELPAHAISATSHFAILLTSPVGLAVHALQHDIVARDVVPLVAGGLLGGHIGARLSLRLKSPQLLLVVAVALVIAAGTLVWRQL